MSSHPSSSDLVVAVLGAGGTMGQEMARNIARVGIKVRAWNRTPENIEALSAAEERLVSCATAAEAAAGAGAILTMLSDAELAVRAAAPTALELPMLEAISRRFAVAAREHGEKDLAAVYLANAPTA